MSAPTRSLSKPYYAVIALSAVMIAVFELGFQMGFNFYLYDALRRIGIVIPPLRTALDSQQVQAAVMAFIMIIVFLLYPIRRGMLGRGVPLYDLVLAVLGFASYVYVLAIFPELMLRIGITTTVDIIFGVMAIALLLEATRRALGFALPIVALSFLLYGFWQECTTYYGAPNLIQKVISVMVTHLYLAKEGIFGIPLFVMVTYVYAFILFGAFLEKLGVGSYITNFVLSILGRKPGGPAKVAVVSSALVGTVSGSSVANVLTTGTFTIPMMKRVGYPPELAGAVEATASTGGQLMPPVMGAAAFVMAEFIGRPYRDIMIAAVIPSLLYFGSVYMFIDLYTKKLKVGALPKEELPSFRHLVKYVYMLAPIPLIAYVLLMGIPPQHAAITALTVAIIAAVIAQPDVIPLAKLILIALIGLVGLGLASLGIHFLAILVMLGTISILLLVIVGIAVHGARRLARAAYEAIVSSGITCSNVFLAASVAGIVQGVLTMTGLVTSLGYMLVDLVAGNLILLLVVAMLISLVLGMGVPTTANYIITSLVSAGAIATAARMAGYEPSSALLAAHMFVFYFGILADVTPPVALAAYAGSTLAKGNFMRTGLYASRLALAGYIAPYMFALHPEVLLVTVHNWTPQVVLSVVLNTLSAFIGMYLIAVGITGWLTREVPLALRPLCVLVGVPTVVLNPMVNPTPLLLTFGMLGGIYALQKAGVSERLKLRPK